MWNFCSGFNLNCLTQVPIEETTRSSGPSVQSCKILLESSAQYWKGVWARPRPGLSPTPSNSYLDDNRKSHQLARDPNPKTARNALRTVRWSNFDHLDPKMGVFLQSTVATPCGHVFIWKLTPENPLRTPRSWPPWSWFSREKSLKIFKVS